MISLAYVGVLPTPGTLTFLDFLRDQIMREHFESGGQLLVVEAQHPFLSVRHTLSLLNMPANPARTPSVWQLLVPKELARTAADIFKDAEMEFEKMTDVSLLELLSLALTPGNDMHVWVDMFDLAERCQVDALFDYIEETGGRRTFRDRGDLLALQKVNRRRDQLLCKRESMAVQAGLRAGSMAWKDDSAATATVATIAAVPENFSPGTRNASFSSPRPSRNLPILSLSKDYLQAVSSHLQIYQTTMFTPPSPLPSPSPSKIKMEQGNDQQEAVQQQQQQQQAEADEQRAREKKKKRKDRERARVKRKNMEKKLETLAQQVEASAEGNAGAFDLDRAQAKYMLDRAKVWTDESAALERTYGEAKEEKEAHLAASRVQLNELLAQAAACAAQIREDLGETAVGDQLPGLPDEPHDPEREQPVSTEAIPRRDTAADKSQETTFSLENVFGEVQVIEECLEGTILSEGSVSKDEEESADTREGGDGETKPESFESVAQDEEESDQSSLFVRQSAPDTEDDQSESSDRRALPPSPPPPPPPSSYLPPSSSPLPSPSPLPPPSPSPSTIDAQNEQSTGEEKKSELSPLLLPLPLDKVPPMEPALPDLGKLQGLIQRRQDLAPTEEDSPAQPALEATTQDQLPVVETDDSSTHQVSLRPVVRLPPVTSYLASRKASSGAQAWNLAADPSGHDGDAHGGFEPIVSPTVVQMPPPENPFHPYQPGLPILAQPLAPGYHVNSLPLPDWIPAGVGQGPIHPISHNGWNFGGPLPPPPPYYAPESWQPGPFIPLPPPHMFGAPPPATWQPLPLGPPVVPNHIESHEPGAGHPQLQPYFPQRMPTVRPTARIPWAPESMASGYPPTQYAHAASQTVDEPTRASYPGFLTPVWLSQHTYPAESSVTFRPKSANEGLDGRLSSTVDGVEMDVPAGWLRHHLENEESSWNIETVTVRRRQPRK